MKPLLLMQPARLGPLELRNRIIFPPMETNMGEPDNTAGERYIQYHAARAKGGAALVTCVLTAAREGMGTASSPFLFKEETLPSLKRLVDEIHKYGAKAAAQLFHGGRQVAPPVTGVPGVAPCDTPSPYTGDMCHGLSREEIAERVKMFGQAALNAKRCGFDAIDIHGAHGYLICEFLSRFTNKRTDEYGGSIANRARFAQEVVREIRRQVGPEIAIIMRLSTIEGPADGLTPEECVEFAKIMADEGVDAFYASAGGTAEAPHLMTPPAALPQAWNKERSAMLKEALKGKAAVITVGRYKSPAIMEEVLEEGAADFVGVGRAMIADPDLPNKIMSGEAIRPCIACNQGCIGGLFEMPQRAISCVANPETGFEYLHVEDKPAKAKHIVIIGAGPCGLELAVRAARRGVKVTLLEKQSQTGGQINAAQQPPHKQEMGELIRFQTEQLQKLGVDLRLNTEATVDLIKSLDPDKVFVASGAVPLVPPIPGLRESNFVTAVDMLLHKHSVPKGKVGIIGGGLIGCETAEYLKENGAEPILFELKDLLAPDAEVTTRICLLGRLKDIECYCNATVSKVEDHAIEIQTEEGVKRFDGLDLVVCAAGSKSEHGINDVLTQAGIEFTALGDTLRPGKIYKAVHDAFTAAAEL